MYTYTAIAEKKKRREGEKKRKMETRIHSIILLEYAVKLFLRL